MKVWMIYLITAVCLCSLTSTTIASDYPYRSIVDSRGVSVEVPTELERVITISDGMIEGVMTNLGLQDKIVGLGSRALQRTWNYTYESVDGETFSYEEGMNPATYLNPKFGELPLIADDAVNYEAVASLDPDLIILRVGSCNFWTTDLNDENVQKTI